MVAAITDYVFQGTGSRVVMLSLSSLHMSYEPEKACNSPLAYLVPVSKLHNHKAREIPPEPAPLKTIPIFKFCVPNYKFHILSSKLQILASELENSNFHILSSERHIPCHDIQISSY